MSDPRSVRCRHILLKHNESRRPYDSFRKKDVTRSVEEAQAGMKEIRKLVTASPDSFEKLAFERSECSSARDGGDLGQFERHQMQKAFSDAAFELKVGDISELVFSDSGIHIILRVE